MVSGYLCVAGESDPESTGGIVVETYGHDGRA